MIGVGVKIINPIFYSMDYNDLFTSKDERKMLLKGVVIGKQCFYRNE